MQKKLLILAVLALGACPAPAKPVEGPPLSATDDKLADALLREAEVEPKVATGEQRGRLVALARQTRCPCPGVRGSLADCANRKRCLRGPFALRAILRAVLRKEKDAAIIGRLLERFGPREPEEIDTSLAPCRGDAKALVTMAVFSDFQCPYCGLGRKLVEELEKTAGKRLRVCFFNFIVHEESRPAARAAVAAHLQGKFWPFHDQLFDHPKAQDAADLLAYAKTVGLDVTRFERDLQNPLLKVRLLRDETLGQKLGLSGTPAFFINGRPMTDPKTIPDFLDWIAEAVAVKKQAAKAPASAPASSPTK